MSFVVYKSSAGSGKTSTLVTEFLCIALDTDSPSTFRHTLAITFTNKAAHEMKERVLQALQHFSMLESTEDVHIADAICSRLSIDKAELGKRAKFLLTDLLHHYADLSISTIDSFVSRLVHLFAYDLNLPFQFRVELKNEELLQQAIDELLDQTGKENTLLTKILTQFILHQTEQEGSRRIESELLNVGKALLKNELKPVFDALSDVSEDTYISLQREWQKQISQFESHCATLGKESLDFIESLGIAIKDFKGGERSGLAKSFIMLQNPKLVRTKFINKEAEKFIAGEDWIGKKPNPAIAANQTAIEERLIPQLRALKEQHQRYIIHQLLLKNVYQQATTNLLSKAFEQVKEQANVVSLSSFNELVNSIVQQESIPFIYERIGERYRHFMVDEFQDTSTMQWENLLPLYANALASGNFNMVVGDAKQSIYRWRGGDVEQFIHLGESPKESDSVVMREHLTALHRNFREELLATNHRSVSEIVTFNNQFFKLAASLLPLEAQAVYHEVEQEFNVDKMGGLVHIQFKADGETEREWQKAHFIETIQHIQVEGKFKLSDICVLCRKNSELKRIANWIEEAGFEVFTFESLTLERSSSVALIGSLMQWYLVPGNPGYAVEVVTRLVESNVINERYVTHAMLQSICASPQQLLQWIHDELGYALPQQFSDELSLYTFYQSICLSLPLPYDAYLSELGNFILSFTEQNGNNLAQFLQHFEQRKGDVSVQSQPNAHAIQLMTIHKSKGLQFPIVMMPFANWSQAPKLDAQWVDQKITQLDQVPYSLVSMSKELEGTSFNELYQAEKARLELDTLNLLYVAFTRPKFRLYAHVDKAIRNGAGKHFLSLIDQLDGYNPDQNLFTIGDGSTAMPHQESTHATEMPALKRSTWQDKIHLSTSRLRMLESHAREEQLFGQYFHGYMQQIVDRHQLTMASRWLANQPIDSKTAEQIKAVAQEMMNHHELQDYFDAKHQVWRETGLFSQGKTLRADRIVETDASVTIIDYKTAKPALKHHHQIRQYGNAIYRQTEKPVQLILVYVDPIQIEQVNFQPDLFA